MANTIREEDLRLNIIVNGDKGRKEMLDLRDSIGEASEKLREMRQRAKEMRQQNQGSSAEYKSLRKEIAATSKSLAAQKERYAELEKQMDISKMSISELRSRINSLRAVLDKSDPDTNTWSTYNAELQKTRQRLAELISQAAVTDKTLCRIASRMNQYMQTSIGMFLHVKQGYDTIRQATDRFAEYDEALTDAMKTTNLTKEEITALSEELAKIDTRTSQNELLALARAGGKLGIEGRDNLLGFVRAADQINVALSEDLGGDAEAAITAIGKMTDIFRLQDLYGVEQAMLKVGSAVNELGMASTANEGYMVDFTQRMAGIAPNADITIDKVLGLAATLDKYGQTAEMSSTAVGQMIQAMFRDTATFAQLAGMSLTEFSGLLDRDVNEAMLRVLGNLRQGGEGLGPIVQAMDAMGLNGQRASQVLGTLADHVDELRVQQELANEAFERGTSLTEEFSVKNTSVTAELEKHQKVIQAQVVTIGQELMPLVNDAMDVAEVGMRLLANLVRLLVEYRVLILSLTAAVFAYNAANKIAVAVTKLNTFCSRAHREALAAELLTMRRASAGTLLLASAQNLLAGSFKGAATAFKMFGKALLANPWGAAAAIIFGALTMIIGKIREANKAQREFAESSGKLADSYSEAAMNITKERDELERLRQKIEQAKVGTDERAEAIRRINERYGQYLPALLTEKSSNDEVADALKRVNDQLERKIRLQSRETEEQRIYQEQMERVKATVDEYAKIYEKANGKEMSPEMRAGLAQAVSRYSSVVSNPSTNAWGRNQANAQLVEQLTKMGIMSGRDAVRTLRVSVDFEKSTLAVAEQRRMLDAYYGSPDDLSPSSSSGADGYSGAALSGDAAGTGGSGSTGGGSGSWSLSSDVKYQESLLELKKKYLSGEIATEKEYNEQVKQLEIDTIRERLDNVAMTNEERVSLESQLQDRLIDRKEAAAAQEQKLAEREQKLAEDGLKIIREVENDKLAEEERRYEAEREKFADNAAVLEALERQHRAKMSQIRLESLNAVMAQTEREHELERTAMLNRQTEELASFSGSRRQLRELKRRQYEELAELDLAYAQKLKGILDAVVQVDGTVSVDFDGLSIEELTQLQQKLQDIIYKVNELQGKPVAGKDSEGKSDSDGERSGMASYGGGGALFGVSQEQWAQFFDNLAQGKLGAQDLQTMLQGVGGVAQEAFKLASLWSERQTALENQQLKAYEKSNDKKKQALQNRLDAGLMTEAQYNAEIERMDAEYDAYQEELQLKQAKRNKQMQLTQAIINTALSVTKALSSAPWPLNLVAAAITAAMGAAEIALIASTPITTGYASGGLIGPDGKPVDVTRSQDGRRFRARLSPDRRGFIGSPTVLVGEEGGEYVIPAEGLDNPTLRPFISTLETARRNGQLKSLNFESVFPPVSGRAAGGYVSASDANQAGSSSSGAVVAVQSDPELRQAIIKLLKRLDDPIEAKVSMLGRNGIVEQTEKYNRMRNRGKL